MVMAIIFTSKGHFYYWDSLVGRAITNSPGRSENISKSYTVPPCGRRVG